MSENKRSIDGSLPSRDDRLKSREKSGFNTITPKSKNMGASQDKSMSKNFTNTIHSDDESEDVIEETAQEDFKSIARLPPLDQLKRVKENEWMNIPKVVKQTFRMLIDFNLEEKENSRVLNKKTNSIIDRLNKNTFEKVVENKLKNIEVKVGASIKSLGDNLRSTIELVRDKNREQVKELDDITNAIKNKLRLMEADISDTKKTIASNLEEVKTKIVKETNEAEKKITLRIDNLIEQNLKIPGVIDDPEGLEESDKSTTLKDYILENIENNKNHVMGIRRLTSESTKATTTINKLTKEISSLESETAKLHDKNTEFSSSLIKCENDLRSKFRKDLTNFSQTLQDKISILESDFTEYKNKNLGSQINSLKGNLEEFKGTNEDRLSNIDLSLVNITEQLERMQGVKSQISEDQLKELGDNFNNQVESKLDVKIQETKDELNSRIDGLEENFNELAEDVDKRFKELDTTTQVMPSPKSPPKRVKSATKKRSIHGKKLEEMRRWLEYQRKFTAEEIKKRTDQYKDQQEAMHPVINTRFELGGCKSELMRRKYENVTHPYQSTVDDLLKSRYEGKEDLSVNFPPVNTMDQRKTSSGNPMTLVEFDDLDKIVVHKRK